MAARKLVLHFNSSVQQLKFFPGGSREDLLAGIREVLDVESDAPLRFRDAEGDVVLVTPGMPSGTVLHVMVESGLPLSAQQETPPNPPERSPSQTAAPAVVGIPMMMPSMYPAYVQYVPTPEPASEAHEPTPEDATESEESFPIPIPVETDPGAPPEQESWQVWDAAVNGTISEDGATFTNRKSGDGWSVYSAPLPTSGQHYFTVECDERLCCIAIGMISTTISSVPHRHLAHEAKYPHLIALKEVGNGPASAGLSMVGESSGMVIGVFVDADRGMVVFVPHDDPQNERRAIRLDDVPVPMKLTIVGPKHDLTATIRPAHLPVEGVYTGAAAIFRKPAASTSE